MISQKKFPSWLLLLPLLLLLLGCSLKGGPDSQIIRAIPERWKKKKALILAIARHETGNFSSNVYRTCNNAFGLKTYKRTNCPAPTGEGVNLFYKYFLSPGDSVLDFVNWLERRNIKPDLSDLEILKKMGLAGYYTDPEYIKKVERWK